ncbi:plasmid maintenance protein [Borreliella valaisiana]|uniref:plasmid maintenance protein n=1 Tax=Borreliella valaisiana TaxID=62088 RepID=UPI003B21CD9D
MKSHFISFKNNPCSSKSQHKLIVLVSTLSYVNRQYKKYVQSNIFYYFNKNLKRNGQTTVTLKTMQNYLYKLEKELKVTTNYYKHLGVNCGTEIYYKLKYPKKECYNIINQYFKEKKEVRFKSRVNTYLEWKENKNGNVEFGECISNKNNKNIREKTNKGIIEKQQLKKYFNKCNFLSKKTLSILDLDLNKDKAIEVLKIIKKIELNLTKYKNNLGQNYSEIKKNQLKKILSDTQEQLEQKGYYPNKLKSYIKDIYEKYKNKPHFIIESQKYKDLSNIKIKLEQSIERKKENSRSNNERIKINIFNILIEQLKKESEIKFLKPTVKNYLNKKNKLEYKKVFDKYYWELLKIIKNKKIV